jgi:hypothetical protein
LAAGVFASVVVTVVFVAVLAAVFVLVVDAVAGTATFSASAAFAVVVAM